MEAKEKRHNLEEAIAEHWDGDPLIPLAHAILETGWFLHVPNNNYWGIKGAGEVLDTLEVEDGETIEVKASFRKYPNAEEALLDYIALIKDKWSWAWKNRTNHRTFFKEMKAKRQWATDPYYQWKLNTVYKKINKEAKEKTIVIAKVETKREGVREVKPVLKRLARGVLAACAVWITADLWPYAQEILMDNPQYGGIAVAAIMAGGKFARGKLYAKYPKVAEWFPV